MTDKGFLADLRRVRLSQLSQKIFQGISSSRSSTIKNFVPDVPVINVKDIVDGQIDSGNLNSITVSSRRDTNRYTILPGDILITCRGTVIKSAVVPKGLVGCLITANLIAIRLGDSLEPALLSAFFQSPVGQRALLSTGRSSSGQIALTVSDVEKIEVPVPPAEIQKKLSGLITSADNYYAAAVESAGLRRDVAYGLALHYLLNPNNPLPEVNSG